MLTTLDPEGQFEEFRTSGVTDAERQGLLEIAAGERFLEYFG